MSKRKTKKQEDAEVQLTLDVTSDAMPSEQTREENETDDMEDVSRVETAQDEETPIADVNDAQDGSEPLSSLGKNAELKMLFAEFVERVRTQPRLTRPQVVEMFNLYSRWSGLPEKNYGCDICAMRIYKRIKELSKR